MLTIAKNANDQNISQFHFQRNQTALLIEKLKMNTNWCDHLAFIHLNLLCQFISSFVFYSWYFWFADGGLFITDNEIRLFVIYLLIVFILWSFISFLFIFGNATLDSLLLFFWKYPIAAHSITLSNSHSCQLTSWSKMTSNMKKNVFFNFFYLTD